MIEISQEIDCEIVQEIDCEIVQEIDCEIIQEIDCKIVYEIDCEIVHEIDCEISDPEFKSVLDYLFLSPRAFHNCRPFTSGLAFCTSFQQVKRFIFTDHKIIMEPPSIVSWQRVKKMLFV